VPFKGAEIKTFTSPDVAHLSMRQRTPQKAGDVYYLIEMAIGPVGEKAADIFAVMIATPEALLARKRSRPLVISDRALVVVKSFRWKEIEKKLRSIVELCSGSSWNESVLRLQRYFLWEYEDFRKEPATGSKRRRP
jgi:Immunity protein 8